MPVRIDNPQLPLQSPRPLLASHIRSMPLRIPHRRNRRKHSHTPTTLPAPPRSLRIQTANNPTSAGVTPLIREA